MPNLAVRQDVPSASYLSHSEVGESRHYPPKMQLQKQVEYTSEPLVVSEVYFGLSLISDLGHAIKASGQGQSIRSLAPGAVLLPNKVDREIRE